MKYGILTVAALCLFVAAPAGLAHAAAPAPAAAPPPATAAANEPTVGADYADARKIAARRKVPVLIEFYTDW